jgi:predicted nucleic acid-binding protein
VKLAFDSNILAYLARLFRAPGDVAKREAVKSLLLRLPDSVERIVPFQVLGECYAVMLRFGYSRERCRDILLDWTDDFQIVASSDAAFMSAIELATDHKLQFWDALIMGVAVEAGCTLLLSEDLQPGFSWRGVKVINPLAETLDERLVRILDAPQ